MTDVGRTTCPDCKAPGQLVLLPCGFCGKHVPEVDVGVDGSANAGKSVKGYRAFRVDRRPPSYLSGNLYAGRPDVELCLQSPVFSDYFWPADVEWHQAECRSHPKAHNSKALDILMVPPVKECGGGGHGCGFYTSRTWAHALENGYHGYTEDNPYVLAEVTLAGKVIAATNGWRAGELRIDVIHVPHELWKLGAELVKAYPQSAIEMSATMVQQSAAQTGRKWCEVCTAKMDKSSNICPWCQHTHR